MAEHETHNPAGRTAETGASTVPSGRGATKDIRLSKAMRRALANEKVAQRSVHTAVRRSEAARRKAGFAYQVVLAADAALAAARREVQDAAIACGICAFCRSAWAEPGDIECGPCSEVPF